MIMDIQTTTLTVAEFLQIEALPENADRILELVNGEVVEKMVSFTPSEIALTIGTHLKLYLFQHPIGRATAADGGYMMGDGNVFIPGVAFITNERLPTTPSRQAPVPPDLAVEVKSPTDRKSQLRNKAGIYLANGMKLVWLVFPDEYVVEVYTPHDPNGHTVSYDGVLNGADVLPAFALKVSEIFGTRSVS
jgi:Uma2 family endonuclease